MISESPETNYIKMGFRAIFFIYSEIELIPPSVSELENYVVWMKVQLKLLLLLLAILVKSGKKVVRDYLLRL